jgi:hypothetical protein
MKALTRTEARKMFSRMARKHFKVKDGQEWLVRYIQNEYKDESCIKMNRMLVLLPFAR